MSESKEKLHSQSDWLDDPIRKNQSTDRDTVPVSNYQIHVYIHRTETTCIIGSARTSIQELHKNNNESGSALEEGQQVGKQQIPTNKLTQYKSE